MFKILYFNVFFNFCICIVLVILLVFKYFNVRSFWNEFRLVFYGLGNGLLWGFRNKIFN